MAKIYARWIRAGRMTIEQVPAYWQDAVRKELSENA